MNLSIRQLASYVALFVVFAGSIGNWYINDYKVDVLESKVKHIEEQYVKKETQDLKLQLVLQKLDNIDAKLVAHIESTTSYLK